MKSNPTTAGMIASRARAVVEPLEGRKLMAVVFGLQANNSLIAFDSASPGMILQTVRVKKGLARGETLRGIDFRPATNQLYGLGSTDRLYTIDTATGEATPVGTTTLSGGIDINQEVGFDFNPVGDRLRIVTESNQNLRVNPTDGTVEDADGNTAGIQFDSPLAYDSADVNTGQNPAVLGVAYTNDTSAALTTTLFGIDAERNVLVRQGSTDGTPVGPNSGTLFTVGTLNVDPLAIGGFDILTSGTTNTAVAAMTVSTRQPSQLYSINLDTGAATSIGNIGRGRKPVLALAFAPAGKSFFVTTSRNELLGLNTATPSFILSKTAVTGFASKRERIVGIDVRPATGELYAATDASRIYTINTTNGVATAVGGELAVKFADRASFGFDFNPSVDRIRVVNSDGQNLRVDPATGAVVDFDTADADIDPDTPLAFVPVGDAPTIVGAAYSTNVAGGSPTTLYVIDSKRDVLATQGSAGGSATSPNTGQLFEVGPTTVNVPNEVGFDIVTTASIDEAFAVFAQGGRGTTNLYSVNVSSGVFTLVSALNKKVKGVTGMTFQTPA